MGESSLHHPTARVLDILERLAAREGGLSLTELAEAISASKSTIFPIMRTLAGRNYISLDDRTMRYSLGAACGALASAAGRRNMWLRLVREAMQQVVDACDEVCQLGILSGRDILYIAKVQCTKVVRLVSDVGTHLPASSTALGKAILSELPEEAVAALYPDGLPTMTEYSVATLEALRRQLEAVRACGYATDDRESSEETICFAVALRHHQHPLAALSVSLPAFRASAQAREAVVAELLKTQAHLEELFAAAEEVLLV